MTQTLGNGHLQRTLNGFINLFQGGVVNQALNASTSSMLLNSNEALEKKELELFPMTLLLLPRLFLIRPLKSVLVE